MAAPLTAFRGVLMFAVGLSATALPALASAAPMSFREAVIGQRLAERPSAPMSFREGLMGQRLVERPDAPVIGRYEMDAGGDFVLDRSASKPLLKFDDDPEIWVLQPAPGPRGDTIYRNDLGEPMLRATRLGGMTVFTPTRPEGSAAALDGASMPLRIAALSPQGLFNRFYQASIRTSRVAQHQVVFETREDAEPGTAAYLADAAVVASEALVNLAGQPAGKALLARIVDVVIAQGPKPTASLQHGVLTVTIVPAQGVAGRPSSRRIERAAGAR
jgi:hypothetical protein